jgi:hypothetical protein
VLTLLIGREALSGHDAGLRASDATTSVQDGRAPDAANYGRIPPEEIQRIVRAHFGDYKHCYQAALSRDLCAGGRTSTKFIIGTDGGVTESVDVSDDGGLPDDVRRCIADEIKKLRFPPPEGGIVTVIYPLIFTPGDFRCP